MSKNYGTLQDKSGNTLIPVGMETVTNSNGTALKFADGTLIQYNNFSVNTSDKQTTQTVNLSVSFVGTYYVVVTFNDSGYGYSEPTTGIGVTSKSASSFKVNVKTTSFYEGKLQILCDYIAIGRWK